MWRDFVDLETREEQSLKSRRGCHVGYTKYRGVCTYFRWEYGVDESWGYRQKAFETPSLFGSQAASYHRLKTTFTR